jgi:hypothetical protein
MEDGGIFLEVSLEWRISTNGGKLDKNSDSCSFDLNNCDDHGILLVYHRKNTIRHDDDIIIVSRNGGSPKP